MSFTKKHKEQLLKLKLEKEIKDLEKKREDMDFVVGFDKKLKAASSAKLEANRRYNNLLKENQDLLSEMDFILDVDGHKPQKVNIQIKKRTTGEAIANMGTGDWHVEEEVRPEEVNFKNKFNLDIASKRVDNLCEGFLRLVEIERYGIDIKKANIYLLGDFYSGYLHDDLMTTNLLTPADAHLFAEDLIFNLLNNILEKGKFEKIDVICHCGNHTRYTKGKYVHHKNQYRKTFEWILYNELAKTFKRMKKDKINFIIPETMYVDYQFGYPVRSQHGHNFKYQGGIGGESISVNKKLLRWDKTDHSYMDLFGHLHMYTTPYNYISIGPLIGYSQLAIDAGYECQPPTQAFFLIGRKRGILVNRPIYVDD